MEETIKRLQIALGVLLIALLVVFITGAALIISYKPEAPVAAKPAPGTSGTETTAPAPAALDAVAQKGESLFKNNCAACHSAGDDVVVGPGLKGISKRAPSKDWLYKWIHNSSAVVASGDAYGNQIFNKFNKIPMQSFPDLANEDIDAILKYLDAQGG
ncbi:cytochrome c [Xanthocytophaga agilis]|uniref:Cytochrome c n=1 Tax=Xanthocytophaga agilis TaxID=3048010 RepID=A0AAE3R098_9BACT|nr:cytochrome c [Xanthocytophaga agilis]MDJ1501306.1 cytochrome c [Xanthocytophaga agilis]